MFAVLLCIVLLVFAFVQKPKFAAGLFVLLLLPLAVQAGGSFTVIQPLSSCGTVATLNTFTPSAQITRLNSGDVLISPPAAVLDFRFNGLTVVQPQLAIVQPQRVLRVREIRHPVLFNLTHPFRR